MPFGPGLRVVGDGGAGPVSLGASSQPLGSASRVRDVSRPAFLLLHDETGWGLNVDVP